MCNRAREPSNREETKQGDSVWELHPSGCGNQNKEEDKSESGDIRNTRC